MLKVADLLAEAQKRTGLGDFGDSYFREGLDRLVDSVNRESSLSAFGAAAYPEVRIHSLVNRLEIEDWYRRHPEIDNEQIVAPVFIVGPPRTGSTLLSYQLSLDPATRSYRFWESERPCPPPIAGQDKTDPRIKEADIRHDAFVAACPAVALMTPYDPSGPVECYEMFYPSFHYMHFDMFTHVPSYMAWINDPRRDHVPAYLYHKRTLKLLQWRCPPKRWQLKMPSHSHMIVGLDKVYPDARFIMTHRDPVKVIPSAAHLNITVRQEFNTDPMKLYYGAYVTDFWEQGIRRLLAFRARNESRFFDIYHADQLKDAIPELIKLYRWLGWEMTDKYLADVKAWRQGNPKRDNPYNAADFGLDADTLRRRFAFYTDRFFANKAAA